MPPAKRREQTPEDQQKAAGQGTLVGETPAEAAAGAGAAAGGAVALTAAGAAGGSTVVGGAGQVATGGTAVGAVGAAAVLTAEAGAVVGAAAAALRMLRPGGSGGDDVYWLYNALRAEYAEGQISNGDLLMVSDAERKFENEFWKRVGQRLTRDLPEAMRSDDPEAAVKRILDRERRWMIAHHEAALNRSRGVIHRASVKSLSPEGAYWVLRPGLKHCVTCTAMAAQGWWSWKILDHIHPPVHPNCGCELLTLAEARRRKLMGDKVPSLDAMQAQAKRLGLLEAAEHADCDLEEGEDFADGIMVAVYPDPHMAVDLALPNGEEAKQLHMTLAYMGKTSDHGDEPPEQLLDALASWARNCPKLDGEISGTGQFTAGPKPVTYASVDCPDLPTWRQYLVDALQHTAAPAKTDHGYTPHITLDYGSRRPKIDAPKPLCFDEVHLVWGKRHYTFPLSGDTSEDELTEVRWDRRYAKGTAFGGRFMPKRGGFSPRITLKDVLRMLMGNDAPNVLGRGGQRSPVSIAHEIKPDVTPKVDTSPAPPLPPHRKGTPPRDFNVPAAEARARAEALAADRKAGLRLGTITALPDSDDHEGFRTWEGDVELGRDVMEDIEQLGRMREQRQIIPDELAGSAYHSYRVLHHELAHAVNPQKKGEYHGSGRAIEEALVEELAHDRTVDHLRADGQHEALRWLAVNPDHLYARGLYQPQRAGLGMILDEAEVPLADRRVLLAELKDGVAPADREMILGGLIARAQGVTPEEGRARVTKLMEMADEMDPTINAGVSLLGQSNLEGDSATLKWVGAEVDIPGRYAGTVTAASFDDEGRPYLELRVETEDGVKWRYPMAADAKITKGPKKKRLEGDRVTGKPKEGGKATVTDLQGNTVKGTLQRVRSHPDGENWRAEIHTADGEVHPITRTSVRDIRPGHPKKGAEGPGKAEKGHGEHPAPPSEAFKGGVVDRAAAKTHEDWRESKRGPDGSYEQREKTTTDEAWIEKHGTDKVDLAQTRYEDLPEDWKAENSAGARDAFEAITAARKDGGALDVEKLSAAVHKAWVKRHKDAPDETKVAYSKLSEDDKQLDRNFVNRTLEAMGIPNPDKLPGVSDLDDPNDPLSFDARRYSNPRRSLIKKAQALKPGQVLELADGTTVMRSDASFGVRRPDGARRRYTTAHRMSNAEIRGIAQRHGVLGRTQLRRDDDELAAKHLTIGEIKKRHAEIGEANVKAAKAEQAARDEALEAVAGQASPRTYEPGDDHEDKVGTALDEWTDIRPEKALSLDGEHADALVHEVRNSDPGPGPFFRGQGRDDPAPDTDRIRGWSRDPDEAALRGLDGMTDDPDSPYAVTLYVADGASNGLDVNHWRGEHGGSAKYADEQEVILDGGDLEGYRKVEIQIPEGLDVMDPWKDDVEQHVRQRLEAEGVKLSGGQKSPTVAQPFEGEVDRRRVRESADEALDMGPISDEEAEALRVLADGDERFDGLIEKLRSGDWAVVDHRKSAEGRWERSPEVLLMLGSELSGEDTPWADRLIDGELSDRPELAAAASRVLARMNNRPWLQNLKEIEDVRGPAKRGGEVVDGVRVVDDQVEAIEHMRGITPGWRSELSRTSYHALESYKYALGDIAVNGPLREGKSPDDLSRVERFTFDGLTAAIRLPLDEDTRVYRGVGGLGPNSPLLHAEPGDEIDTDGLLSTSMNRGVAERFATLGRRGSSEDGQQAIIEMDLPEGTQVAPLQHFMPNPEEFYDEMLDRVRDDPTDPSGEAELLLRHGTSMEVVEAHTDEQGRRILRVRLTHDGTEDNHVAPTAEGTAARGGVQAAQAPEAPEAPEGLAPLDLEVVTPMVQAAIDQGQLESIAWKDMPVGAYYAFPDSDGNALDPKKLLGRKLGPDTFETRVSGVHTLPENDERERLMVPERLVREAGLGGGQASPSTIKKPPPSEEQKTSVADLTPEAEALRTAQIEDVQPPAKVYRTENANAAYKTKALFGDGLYVGTDPEQVRAMQLDPETGEGDVKPLDEIKVDPDLELIQIEEYDLPTVDGKPLAGEKLRSAVLQLGYDGIYLRSESLNMGGDQIVFYNQTKPGTPSLGVRRASPAEEQAPDLSDLANPEQEKYFGWYKGPGHISINAALRGETEPSDDDREATKAMDAVFEQAKPFEEPVELWRFVAKPLEDIAEDHAVGSVVTDKGFGSTSSTQDVSGKLPRSLGDVWQIKATPGTKGVRLVSPRFGDEREVLLDRDTKYRITGIREEGDSRIIEAETVQASPRTDGDGLSGTYFHQSGADAAQALQDGKYDTNRSTGYFGAGLYLSPERTEKGTYGGTDTPVEFTLRNPFDAASDEGFERFDEIDQEVSEALKADGLEPGSQEWPTAKAAAVTEKLKSMGYDGVRDEDGNVVVFDAKSVKAKPPVPTPDLDREGRLGRGQASPSTLQKLRDGEGPIEEFLRAVTDATGVDPYDIDLKKLRAHADVHKREPRSRLEVGDVGLSPCAQAHGIDYAVHVLLPEMLREKFPRLAEKLRSSSPRWGRISHEGDPPDFSRHREGQASPSTKVHRWRVADGSEPGKIKMEEDIYSGKPRRRTISYRFEKVGEQANTYKVLKGAKGEEIGTVQRADFDSKIMNKAGTVQVGSRGTAKRWGRALKGERLRSGDYVHHSREQAVVRLMSDYLMREVTNKQASPGTAQPTKATGYFERAGGTDVQEWDMPNGQKLVTADVDGTYRIIDAPDDEINDFDPDIDATDLDQWLANADPADYVDEPDWNADFWDGVGKPWSNQLFHATTEENLDSIMEQGLQARDETRGLTNRNTGSAVFASPNPGTLDSYGDIKLAIDTEAMKRDGYMPEAGPELPQREDDLRGSLYAALGHDYNAGDSMIGDGIDPETILFHDDIPPKYLSQASPAVVAERREWADTTIDQRREERRERLTRKQASPSTTSLDDLKGKLSGDGVTLQTREDGDGIRLDLITVFDQSQRNQRRGDNAMKALTDFADNKGLPIALTPRPGLGKPRMNKAELTKWYRRHGFKPNSGKNADPRFDEEMIRRPDGQASPEIEYEWFDGGQVYGEENFQLAEMANAWAAGLTPEERNVVESYTEVADTYGKWDILDQVANTGTLPEPTTLYRAVSDLTAGDGAVERLKGLKPGDSWSNGDKLISTSMDERVSREDFGEALNVGDEPYVLLDIDAPAGTAAGFPSLSSEMFVDQREVLLPTGQSFEVMEVADGPRDFGTGTMRRIKMRLKERPAGQASPGTKRWEAPPPEDWKAMLGDEDFEVVADWTEASGGRSGGLRVPPLDSPENVAVALHELGHMRLGHETPPASQANAVVPKQELEAWNYAFRAMEKAGIRKNPETLERARQGVSGWAQWSPEAKSWADSLLEKYGPAGQASPSTAPMDPQTTREILQSWEGRYDQTKNIDGDLADAIMLYVLGEGQPIPGKTTEYDGRTFDGDALNRSMLEAAKPLPFPVTVYRGNPLYPKGWVSTSLLPEVANEFRPEDRQDREAPSYTVPAGTMAIWLGDIMEEEELLLAPEEADVPNAEQHRANIKAIRKQAGVQGQASPSTKGVIGKLKQQMNLPGLGKKPKANKGAGHDDEVERSKMEAPPALVEGIPNYDAVNLKDHKAAGGSNGARFMKDPDGNKWLLKHYKGDQQRVATELLSNAIYREMGVTVPNAGILEQPDRDGQPKAITYPLVDGETRHWTKPDATLAEGFVTDALLGNWDVIGLSQDNVLWNGEDPIRVDQGGTLEMRAQGGAKPFGPVPTELWTMQSPMGGQAFGRMDITEAGMRRQAKDIELRLTPEKIDGLVDAAPFTDEEMRERVRETLKARVAWLGDFSRGEQGLPEPLEGNDVRNALSERDFNLRLTAEEELGLAALTTTPYIDQYIDKVGWQKAGKGDDKLAKVTKALDNLLRDDVTRAPEDTVGYMPLSSLYDIGIEDIADADGKEFRDTSFLRLNFEDTGDASTVGVRVSLPVGTNVIVPTAEMLGVDEMPPEQMILSRGMRLKVVGAAVENGRVMLEVAPA